jgi:hypothetical protein
VTSPASVRGSLRIRRDPIVHWSSAGVPDPQVRCPVIPQLRRHCGRQWRDKHEGWSSAGRTGRRLRRPSPGSLCAPSPGFAAGQGSATSKLVSPKARQSLPSLPRRTDLDKVCVPNVGLEKRTSGARPGVSPFGSAKALPARSWSRTLRPGCPPRRDGAPLSRSRGQRPWGRRLRRLEDRPSVGAVGDSRDHQDMRPRSPCLLRVCRSGWGPGEDQIHSSWHWAGQSRRDEELKHAQRPGSSGCRGCMGCGCDSASGGRGGEQQQCLGVRLVCHQLDWCRSRRRSPPRSASHRMRTL